MQEAEGLTDLHALARAGTMQLPVHAQVITRQILEALREYHVERRMCHNGLSSSCVQVMDEQCRVELVGFESASSIGTREYLRFNRPLLSYRAPEVLVGRRHCDPAQDMWSVGCLVYEAFAGRSPYVGAGVVALLRNLLELGGRLPSTPGVAPRVRRNVCEEMGGHEVAADFVLQLLVLDPGKRMTVEEALLHEFVNV